MKKQITLIALILFCFYGHLFSNSLDFCDHSVLVIMKNHVDVMNTRSISNIFDGIQITSVTDLTENTSNPNAFRSNKATYKQILKLDLPLKDKENVKSVINQLQSNNYIEYAEPNYIITLNHLPNDPQYTAGNLWGLNKIEMPATWALLTGSHDIRAGIMDTGIARHPDLDANLVDGFDLWENKPIIINDPSTFIVLHPHGTHVAGTVGAVGNNGIGVVGVNWNVSLVPLRIDHNGNNAFVGEMVKAIAYAENNDIHVLNMSFSGYGFSESVRQAILDYSGLFTWSAGNQQPNQSEPLNVDLISGIAAYHTVPNLISVGASTSADSRAGFSYYGQNSVHIYAPGQSIVSTVLSDGYAGYQGTSMAAPHVAGVAAMLLAAKPSLTAAELKDIILENADLITISTPAGEQTVRRLNARKAIEATGAEIATIGKQDGILYTGSQKTFTFPVNSINIPNGTVGTVTWFTTSAGTTPTVAPTGLSASATVISDNTATININMTPSAVAETYYFNVTYRGYESNITTLVLTAPIPLPYTQDFESITNLNAIRWGGRLSAYSGIFANSGTNNTNGLVLDLWRGDTSQNAFTPVIGTITPHSNLSFSYRITRSTESWTEPLMPYILGRNEAIFVEISTTGEAGPYTIIQTINNTNHETTTSFRSLTLSLSAFAGQNINLRFRNVWEDNEWVVVIDDVNIYNPSGPVFNISPVAYNFTDTNVGQTSAAQTFTITNIGIANLVINEVIMDGDDKDQFILSSITDLPWNITPNETRDFTVSFSPTSLGGKSASISISDNLSSAGQLTGAKQIVPIFGNFLNFDIPQAVRLISPTNNATGTSVMPNLVWDSSGGRIPTSYQVLISDTQDMSNILYDTVVNHPSTEHQVSITMNADKKYFWQIIAENQAGVSLNNQIWSFYTFDIPSPRLLHATVENQQVYLSWTAPETGYLDVIRYKIYRNNALIDSTSTLTYLDNNITDGYYRYQVAAVYYYSDFDQYLESSPAAVETAVACGDDTIMTQNTGLIGNYPNPFNPTTTIEFRINSGESQGKGSQNVVIDIFNAKGQKVRSLVNDYYSIGTHSVIWNGNDDHGTQVGSGLYFYRMQTDGYKEIRRMIMIK